jgi:hypothetical protein
LGFYYRNNAKAWMVTIFYQEWILLWDRELEGTGRKIILLQDNFSGHVPPEGLRNIWVMNFEPNLTAHVQPMDQGIIKCWKAHYRAAFIRRAIDRYDQGVTPSNIYKINQLEAMRLADAAWQEIEVKTIRNCWKKAGILPNSLLNSNSAIDTSADSDEIQAAEKDIENALDNLEATGALQSANRMSVEALLNPSGEPDLLSSTSPEDIFQAVMEARDASENMDINGGDDDDPVDLPPTRREVLQASDVIKRHLMGLDTRYARELEALLASMNRDLRLEDARSMQNTTITSYFT